MIIVYILAVVGGLWLLRLLCMAAAGADRSDFDTQEQANEAMRKYMERNK